MLHGIVPTLYARHWWANRTLLDATAKLGEVVATREIGPQFSEPTLKRLFWHLYVVDGLWLARWRGVSPSSVPPEAEVAPTLAELGERWVTLETEQKAFLDALADGNLDREIDYRLISGKAYRQPLGALLIHVTDHGTHHRSELATMLTMVSGPPPETGLAHFLTIRSGQEGA